MFAGLAAAAREVFEDLLEIRVELPWPDPRGGQLFARVRPHDCPGFTAVLGALGLAPKTTLARQTDATREARRGLKAKNGRGNKKDNLATLSGMLGATGVDEPLAIALGFDTGRAYYVPDEIDRLRSSVCRELCVAIEREHGNTLESWPSQDCEAWFLSDAPIPYRLEEGDDVLPFAGESEGRALTAQILIASMEEERFRARLDPLASSSATSPDGEAESPQNTSSELA